MASTIEEKEDSGRQTRLVCMDCGHTADPLRERVFKCPACGGLYDVHHKDWRAPSAYTRTSVFDERALPCQSVYHNSGVWRFSRAEGLLMPFIKCEHIVSLGEGLHRIVRAGRHLHNWIGPKVDLWVLEEGANPTGSFKDNGMTVAVSMANASGANIVICRSTGDTSAAAAAYAARAGIPCVVLLPRDQGITAAQMAQPLVHGATVIMYPGTFDSVKGAYNELVESGAAYPVNSINPFRIEGHTATAYLIAQFFRWELPDWIAVPVGNGSDSSSVGIGMRRLLAAGIVKKPARVLGVQAHSADPLYAAWEHARNGSRTLPSAEQWLAAYSAQEDHVPGRTAATAQDIGDPASYKKVIREISGYEETDGFPGARQTASEEDIRAAVAMAARDGIEICPQTGVALAGLRNAVGKGIVPPEVRVVLVSTAHLTKFPDVAARASGNQIKEIASCSADLIARIAGL